LISLYYLIKKLRSNRTAYARTRLSSCRNMPHFIALDMWYPICSKMQNVTVKEPCNVLLLHYMSISVHTLCNIAFKCWRQ